MSKPARLYTIKSDGTTSNIDIFDPDGKKLGMVTSLNLTANAEDALIKARIGILTKADVKVLEEYVEVVEIDVLNQKLKEAEEKLERVKKWMDHIAKFVDKEEVGIDMWSPLKDILGIKSGWAWKEKPGLAWGNINGENVPLNEETRKTARHTTLGEMLGHPKCSHTQQDYEDIEDHCCEGSEYYVHIDYELNQQLDYK